MRGLRGGVTLVLTCVVMLGAAGCGGGDADSSGTPPGDEVFLPTESPGEGSTEATGEVVSMIDPPADYSTVEGDGFEISAPSEFKQDQATSANGEPSLFLELPSSVPAVPQRVAVIRDVDPQQSAAEQSFALETLKASAGPEAESTRVEIPAEEGQAAFLMTWKELQPSQGADNVEVTYWQLMHQVSPDLIINVVALAPTDEFETSEVSKILRTFKPTGDSA